MEKLGERTSVILTHNWSERIDVENVEPKASGVRKVSLVLFQVLHLRAAFILVFVPQMKTQM